MRLGLSSECHLETSTLMKVPLTGGYADDRAIRPTAKVIPFPPRQRRGSRVGTVVVVLGVISSMAARTDGLSSDPVQVTPIQSRSLAQKLQPVRLADQRHVQAGLASLRPHLALEALSYSRDWSPR